MNYTVVCMGENTFDLTKVYREKTMYGCIKGDKHETGLKKEDEKHTNRTLKRK
jgi:hypothetical protein